MVTYSIQNSKVFSSLLVPSLLHTYQIIPLVLYSSGTAPTVCHLFWRARRCIIDSTRLGRSLTWVSLLVQMYPTEVWAIPLLNLSFQAVFSSQTKLHIAWDRICCITIHSAILKLLHQHIQCYYISTWTCIWIGT